MSTFSGKWCFQMEVILAVAVENPPNTEEKYKTIEDEKILCIKCFLKKENPSNLEKNRNIKDLKENKDEVCHTSGSGW